MASTRGRQRSGRTMQYRPVTARRAGLDDHQRDPFNILVFLFPLILVYEIGSRYYLESSDAAAVQTIRAHSVLLAFFQDFGIAGRLLPSITIVVVLAIWHVLAGGRFRVKPVSILAMTGESLALTLPLVVFLALIQLALGSGSTAAVQTDPGTPLANLPWRAGLVISIGAGLYEEFLFRLIGVSALHLILVDLGRMTDRAGTALAVVLSAAAFAAYHDVIGPQGKIDAVQALTLMAAGIYFGGVFVTRGFGVAVGVHVAYDVCVLVFGGRSSG